jgi:lactose/L-arabinose transport system ATP-binding protein
VLKAGRVEQMGSPAALYADPDNEFVAGFIGSPRMNFFRASVSAGGTKLEFGGISAPLPETISRLVPGLSLKVGIRPEHLDEAQGIVLEAQVDIVEQLGSTSYVHAALSTGENLIAEKRNTQLRGRDQASLCFDARQMRLFQADGTRIR